MRLVLSNPGQREEVNATIYHLPEHSPLHEGLTVCDDGVDLWIAWRDGDGFRLQTYTHGRQWWNEVGRVSARGGSWGGDRRFFWRTRSGVSAMVSNGITRLFVEAGLIPAREGPKDP